MKMLKRGFAGLLVLTFLLFNLPKTVFCGDPLLFAKADKKTITHHDPKIMATPEKDIPMVQAGEKEQQGRTNYLWLGLGAAVLLGLVAAGGGGGGDGGDGGGDGGGSDEPSSEETGNIEVEW
jgi:hypothetical protein